MKKNMTFYISLIFITMIATTVYAANLVWSPSNGSVDGYKIYYGTSSSYPSNSMDVGNTTQYSLNQLPLDEKTQYFFCVSAYNSSGESAPCAPVAYTPADTTPPSPPVGLIAQ